ncbi:hypothetical protein BC941DRAFT_361632 [Chlamydoabsidia padenii]|nr:hypothetical protein BC941DRAFT_361632 [Chlamydoabsidia padenii]
MNISLQFEPLDCSFYDWPSDIYAVQQQQSLTSKNITDDAKRKKQALRCLHAIDELLQTERDYTNHLTHLVEVCFDQILQRQKWIMDKHKDTITRNSAVLLQFHKSLLVALEEANSKKDIIDRCGDIATVFLNMGSNFTLYDTYCDQHDAAITLCNEYRSKPEWLVFTRECATPTLYTENSLEQVTKPLHFEDYLIKPVQRVCRYQLLLKEILCHIPRATAEYRRLDCALEMMHAVVAGIDRRKYHRDTTERTRLFIDRLDTSDRRLDKESLYLLGSLVMAGAIDVTYSSLGQTTVSSSRSKYLGCFIFPTYLIMVRAKKVTSYTPKHWFPLRLVELEDLQDIQDQREHAFVVRCKKHCFAFTATCQREKRLWITKLSQAIATAKSEPRSADNFIVSSLHGVTKPTKIRTSSSVTNLLEFGSRDSTSSSTSSNATTSSSTCSSPYSSSTATWLSQSDTIKRSKSLTALGKRHSVDFSPRAKRREHMKIRIHSEMYIRPPNLIDPQRRRPGSVDIMPTSSSQLSLNMIGKIKNNHQHALRVGSDHKLRDVCTQDYLASRSWSTLLRESSIGQTHSISSTNSSSSTSNNNNDNASMTGRRKSSLSNLRSSTSSFSMLMSPSRRVSDGSSTFRNHPDPNKPRKQQQLPCQQKQSKRFSTPPPLSYHPTDTSCLPKFGLSQEARQTTVTPSSESQHYYYSGDKLSRLDNHQQQQQHKKKTLRSSLSTYSLHIQPMKHVFVDGFRRLSSRDPPQVI